MFFDCNFTYYPEAWDPNLMLREMVINVCCATHDDTDVVAARLAVDHLDIGRAIESGVDVYEICDADSSGWESLFAALFEPRTQADWRQELQFDEVISHVLFWA
ncbi:MAG: hypothetical protein WEA31_08630 [Pirellulales bacterium]